MRLVALALVLVTAVLGGLLAAGGGDFVPRRPADPCANQGDSPLDSPAQLEPLAEQIVLAGLTETACATGLSRERLVLDIGTGGDVDPEALREGMTRGLDRLGELPPVSDLLDQALDLVDLPGIAKDAIRAVPDGVVDDLLPTRELLDRAITELDVEAVLNDLDDPEAALREALLEAVGDQVVASVKDVLP